MSHTFSNAYTFLKDNSKLNENGSARSVTQGQFLQYYQDTHSINAETLKTVAQGKRELVTASAELATEDLVNLCAKAKADNLDPTDLSASVRISTPEGPLSTEVLHSRTTTNPANGEKSTKHGVIVVKARVKTLIDPTIAEYCADQISKLIG